MEAAAPEAACSLGQLAANALMASPEVGEVRRVWRVLAPFDTGDATEVLFEGRRSGEPDTKLLTARLSDADDGPGFAPDVLITEGW